MDKVVILARVSTDSQEYQRQINELTDYCGKVGWEVTEVFANKVSGAKKIEEREEILSLVEYVKEHRIKRVVCLEISRVGRNTLEALKIIQFLTENGVSLFVKNYNIETLDANGKPNPITSLICTILLEIASMERLTIKERMESGRKQYIDRCRKEGIKMGRPSTYRKSVETYKEQYPKEISLIRKGLSLKNISVITGTSINTIRKIRDIVRQ
ncbi:Site-specific DNA recombinase [Bacteroides faecichinchillae]|uniref:Site-specific DNA recombinase n=1 Tax=Bacteroides faecichinchillae TaxID=871325 RepID=A0A1M5A6B0_9BACE|nr:recombinase family protein [Bacteroides faecichinchillae]THG68485.1 recombinase family protein [Bacteroides faecichinchillae]SHF25667.1 Site-specific DNA recombinase [Bacteroides faecichinchillae]